MSDACGDDARSDLISPESRRARYHRRMAASAKYEPDTAVVYCHEGEEALARVTETHPETGEVLGLALYDQDGRITGGVTDPKLATIPQHRITHGYFWRRS